MNWLSARPGPVKLLNEHRANVFFHALAGAAHTSVSYRENSNTNPVTVKPVVNAYGSDTSHDIRQADLLPQPVKRFLPDFHKQ